MSVHAQTLNYQFRFSLVQTEWELLGMIFGTGIGTGTGFYFLKEVDWDQVLSSILVWNQKFNWI
jgi:hypothetical protein